MIMLKATHEKVISLKDADIKLRDNKIKNLSKQRYKDIEKIENLKEEIKLLKTEISMKTDTINDKQKEIDKLICNLEVLTEYKQNSEDIIRLSMFDVMESRQKLDRIAELKRQIQDEVNRALEISILNHEITEKDMKKYISKRGIEGIIKLYMLGALL